MINKDKLFLEHILDSIKYIEKFVSGGNTRDIIYNDEKTRFAVCKNIEIIGEASAKVSEKIKQAWMQVEWREIKDFRNHLVHEYFDIDYEEVYVVVTEKLPQLKEQITKILSELK